MNISLQNFMRVYCWHKLLKLWGALRCHDSEGIPPSSIRFDPQVGLEGEIHRSKTTGSGKRIEIVQFHISCRSWLVHKEWIQVGLEIYTIMARRANHLNKDFLMPIPDETLANFRRRTMKYPDAMSFSRAMWSELLAPIKDEKGRHLPLLRPESSCCWSEHSERVTITSWAAVIGVDKEIRRRWGRWRPSVDEDYVTTTRRLLRDAQKEVAGRIRRQHGALDVVDDRSVVNNFTVWLQDVHKKTVTQANLEGQCIAPEHWGSPKLLVELKSTSEKGASGGYVPTSPPSNLDVVEDSPSLRRKSARICRRRSPTIPVGNIRAGHCRSREAKDASCFGGLS